MVKLSSRFLFSPSFSESPSLLSSCTPLAKLGAPQGSAFEPSSFSTHRAVSLLYFSPCSAPLVSAALSSSCLLVHHPGCGGPEYISQRNLPALGLWGEGLSCQRRERFPKGLEHWALQDWSAMNYGHHIPVSLGAAEPAGVSLPFFQSQPLLLGIPLACIHLTLGVFLICFFIFVVF